MKHLLTACLAVALLPAAAGAQDDHAAHSAHVGKETRAIKALSVDQMTALLEGAGAGYALAAELNHYPGPRHVLDLGGALSLTASQTAAIARIFDDMTGRARVLGRALVDRERALDVGFRDRTLTADVLREALAVIGRLESELRFTHLEAHLRTAAVLTPDQIARYDQERGYARVSP